MQNAISVFVGEGGHLETKARFTDSTRPVQEKPRPKIWVVRGEELPENLWMSVCSCLWRLVSKVLIEQILAESGEGVNVLQMFCNRRVTHPEPTVGHAPQLVQPERQGTPVAHDDTFDMRRDSTEKVADLGAEFVL